MSKPCPNCDGFGWEVAPAPCPRCEGHGCAYCNDGAVPEQVPCRMCGGSGVVEVPEDA